MKNFLFIGALVSALVLIVMLYQQLTAAERALDLANRRFADCEKVTFQLQNQLANQQRTARGEKILSDQ